MLVNAPLCRFRKEGEGRQERKRKEEREGEGKKGGRKSPDPGVPQNACPSWRKGYTRRRGDAEQRQRLDPWMNTGICTRQGVWVPHPRQSGDSKFKAPLCACLAV